MRRLRPAVRVVVYGLCAAACRCDGMALYQSNAAQGGSTIAGELALRLVATELLEAPVGGDASSFKPLRAVPVGAKPSAPIAAMFYVTVAANADQPVQARALQRTSNIAHSLEAVTSPPACEEALHDASSCAADEALESRLASGHGVFWLAGTDEANLLRRYGVLLPASLLAEPVRLSLFVETAPDGTPIGAVDIELVHDFFYMAVLGDSIQWGNGLLESKKISTLVADRIAAETGRRVIVQRYAISGAGIMPSPDDETCTLNCYGEIPRHYASVHAQALQMTHPEQLDLVLMDGCIVDVGVFGALVNPAMPLDELEARTVLYCRDEVADLLRLVRDLAPNAHIVYTGYPPIITDYSDVMGLQQWLSIQQEIAPLVDSVDLLVEGLVARCKLFYEVSTASLIEAVDTVNAEQPGEARIAFADSRFGPENAMFTGDSWLWSLVHSTDALTGVGIDIGIDLLPEDPLTQARLQRCADNGSLPAVLQCVYVSVAHPNTQGAIAYAESVLDELARLGALQGL